MTKRQNCAYFITPDGRTQTDTVEKPTLETMQQWVGGYVEHVQCRWRGRVCSMYLNEEGKLRGLPRNELATQAFRDLYPTTDDFIVGNVVILGGWK